MHQQLRVRQLATSAARHARGSGAGDESRL